MAGKKTLSPKPVRHQVEIVPDLERQRLDKVLTALLGEKIPALSRARLQALLAGGQVTLKGAVVRDASRKVKAGEVFEITLPPPIAAKPEAQDMDLEIVFEDKDLLVINKPVGMVVHPAPGNRDKTMVNALLAHCGKTLSGIGGVARPGIVHRLDKDTSGLIIVAKNDLAHQNLTKQFADRSLSRTYRAVVWGVPTPQTGSIEARIGRHARDRKKMAVMPKGREALTFYKVVEDFGIASLIECKLATGRTHQIRVHLAFKKYPVVGDPVYGRGIQHSAFSIQGVKTDGKIMSALNHFPRQALHAVELKFLHPRSGKEMRFKADMPSDMKGLLKKLRAC